MNMKIGGKITLLSTAAITGLVVVFVVALIDFGELNNMFTYIGKVPVKNLELANSILDDINATARHTAMLCFDTVNVEKRIKTNENAEAKMKKTFKELHANVNPKDKEMQRLLANLNKSLDEMMRARLQFCNMIQTGNLANAQQYRRTTLTEALYQAIEDANKIVSTAKNQTYHFAFVDSVELVEATQIMLITIAMIVTVILIAFSVVIIMGITKPLKKAVAAAKSVAQGHLTIDLKTNSKDETGLLLNSFGDMVQKIESMIRETNTLSAAAIAGKLEVRADASKHQGAYKELIMGINKTLDAVIAPLNITATYVDRISKGDIPSKITDNYNGDFNEIKKNLNACIDAVGLLVVEISQSINNASNGNLKYRADASKHQGEYSKIMQEVNRLVATFVEPIETTSAFLRDAAVGSKNIQKITKEYKGEFNVIKASVNTLHDVLYNILGEMTRVSTEAQKGNLDVKADSSKVQGAWIQIMEGLNSVTNSAGAIINDAENALSIMATGDLTPRIGTRYLGKFGEMRDSINNLGDSLTNLITQLTEAIHTTATASSLISATADTLAAATQETSTQTEEVAIAMEEMSRTVADNAHNASKTAGVAKNSGVIANDGGEVVRHTVEKMREISLVVRTSADNIAKLGENSKKIGEIISVIDDIADQINLLSLNAAIEAARAGEQGRGFAVVADSVGKLAISTAGATKEIAEMIQGIQNDTEAAVRAMEQGTSEVQSGIELADNAGSSIQSILSGIGELLLMVNQIAAASEEQSTTSEEISQNVSLISKVVADSARNIEGVASTANELAQMTETLSALVSQFKVSRNGASPSFSSNSRYLR